MISNAVLIVFGLLLVTISIVIQSAPVKPIKKTFELIQPVKSLKAAKFNHLRKKRDTDESHEDVDDQIEDTSNENIHDIFTDTKMNSNELNLSRKRRNPDGSSNRRKRSLTFYDTYNIDPYYESQEYLRPTRAFAPTYWSPFIFERHIRTSPEWDQVFSNTIDNDVFDDDPVLIVNDNDDENEYEYMMDDLPINEDYFLPRYEPLESYLK